MYDKALSHRNCTFNRLQKLHISDGLSGTLPTPLASRHDRTRLSQSSRRREYALPLMSIFIATTISGSAGLPGLPTTQLHRQQFRMGLVRTDVHKPSTLSMIGLFRASGSRMGRTRCCTINWEQGRVQQHKEGNAVVEDEDISKMKDGTWSQARQDGIFTSPHESMATGQKLLVDDTIDAPPQA